MVAPVVEQLATERAGRMKVAKVNADLAPATSARHRITGIPALLVYSGGREIGRSVGALPPAELRRWVDTTISAPPG
jgi:thioredoxin-like negative regulator of GroEL